MKSSLPQRLPNPTRTKLTSPSSARKPNLSKEDSFMSLSVNNTSSNAALRLLLNAKEAADALAISPRKLWELTNTGDIRCVRIGKAVRYAVDDLRNFIAAQA